MTLSFNYYECDKSYQVLGIKLLLYDNNHYMYYVYIMWD